MQYFIRAMICFSPTVSDITYFSIHFHFSPSVQWIWDYHPTPGLSNSGRGSASPLKMVQSESRTDLDLEQRNTMQQSETFQFLCNALKGSACRSIFANVKHMPCKVVKILTSRRSRMRLFQRSVTWFFSFLICEIEFWASRHDTSNTRWQGCLIKPSCRSLPKISKEDAKPLTSGIGVLK